MKTGLMFLVLAFALPAFAESQSDLVGKRFSFEYRNGNSYLMSFETAHLTWECTQGAEKGKTERDAYDSDEIAPRTYFMSWREQDGTYVSLVLDLGAMKVWSRGIYGVERWATSGRVVAHP